MKNDLKAKQKSDESAEDSYSTAIRVELQLEFPVVFPAQFYRLHTYICTCDEQLKLTQLKLSLLSFGFRCPLNCHFSSARNEKCVLIK